MLTRKLYRELAILVDARKRCSENNKHEWYSKHTARIEMLIGEHMPSGSGIDSGVKIDYDKSTGDKLVFNTAFHHMDTHGGYDGWTEHRVIVKPSLMHGYTVTITGRNRNDIKDYLAELFSYSLDQELTS